MFFPVDETGNTFSCPLTSLNIRNESITSLKLKLLSSPRFLCGSLCRATMGWRNAEAFESFHPTGRGSEDRGRILRARSARRVFAALVFIFRRHVGL